MIRDATPADVPALVDMLTTFYRAVARTLKVPPLSLKKILALLDDLIAKHKVLVILEGDKVVGACGIKLAPTWFSDEPILQEIFTYVLPQFRSSRHGVKLLQAARNYAIIQQKPLVAAILTGEDATRKTKLYQRLGYKFLGGTFGVSL